VRALLAAVLTADLLSAVTPIRAVAQTSPLPPGEGRDIVAVACTQCHAPSVFTQMREGPAGWRLQIYDMILRGAQVRPSEIDQAVDYLTINFGPGINLPPQTAQVSLPEGAARDLLEQRCSLCHGLDRIAAPRRSSSEWHAIVSRMIVLGAPATADDAKRITAYLDSNLATKL
jgi:mono/diheme cytochrome c family protein